MRFSKAILFSAATLMLPILGGATPLNQIPKAGLSIDGLTFDNFTYQVNHAGYATPHNAQGIDVTAIDAPGTGIRFSSAFFATVPAAVTAKNPYFVSYADATVGYEVKSAAGINEVGLDFDGHATGSSMAGVDEIVFDGKGHWLGFLSVGCYGQDLGGVCTQSDTLKLKGLYNELYIVKDMGVESFGGSAGFSFVDQTFDPTATATPEPASFALMGAGLIGVAGLLRRRTKAGESQA